METAIKDLQSVRDYWNARPCNIRHSPSEFGTRQYFDEVEERKYFVEPHIPIHADFEKWRGKSVLEIGCGIGTDTVSFARHGAIVTSVDLSEKSVEITKQRLDVYGLKADVRVANAEQLSSYLDPEPYDLVYSFGVLHHTPNPYVAFSECLKFMGPESELRMMLYHKGAFKVFQIIEENGWDYSNVDEKIAYSSEAQSGCPVTYTYTQEDIREALEMIGFKDVETSVDHIFPYVVEEYKQYKYRMEDFWAGMTEEAFDKFQKRYGWHLLIRAKKA